MFIVVLNGIRLLASIFHYYIACAISMSQMNTYTFSKAPWTHPGPWVCKNLQAWSLIQLGLYVSSSPSHCMKSNIMIIFAFHCGCPVFLFLDLYPLEKVCSKEITSYKISNRNFRQPKGEGLYHLGLG